MARIQFNGGSQVAPLGRTNRISGVLTQVDETEGQLACGEVRKLARYLPDPLLVDL